jgi:LAS superfamily LD-carboxypeptidase LdcB
MEKVKNGFGKLSDGIKSFVSDHRVVVARLFFFAAFSVIIFFAVAIIFSMVLHSGLSLRGMQPTDLPGTPATGALSVGEVTVDYEETLPPERVFTYEFITDLSAYEEYMNPTDPSAFMVLLNKQNPILDPSYEPETLVYIENEIKNYWIDATVAKALEAMLMEIKAAGFNDIYITSGYRSYNYQSILYDNYINAEMSKNPNLTREEAEKLASTYSAKPGTSEHHTGLCVDITTTAMGGLLEESFADLEIYDWLVANAWKFGFTLRYPSDKVDITGYVFEPWHWRFVGRDAALEMLRTGECFEEYLERTQIAE